MAAISASIAELSWAAMFPVRQVLINREAVTVRNLVISKVLSGKMG
jgi:hypothetical protein